jgi:hypothetical protein
MLSSLGEDAKEWRTLALALLEEQQWSREIGRADFDRVASSREDACSTVASGVPQLQSKTYPLITDGRSKLATGYRPFLAALAAGVLLMVGFYGGVQRDAWLTSDPYSPQRASDSASVSSRSSDTRLATSPGRSNDSMKIVLTGPNSETAEIPVYDIKDFDPSTLWAAEDFEFKRANEQLRRRGFELDVRPEFYTGTLNDGRQLVVPVKQVGLRPYGQ